MSYVIVVGPDSEVCSKWTVPETLESPRTTATRLVHQHVFVDYKRNEEVNVEVNGLEGRVLSIEREGPDRGENRYQRNQGSLPVLVAMLY